MIGPAPLLVFAIGNPSRGDDALGPLFAERLEHACADAIARGALEVLTDFQLQVEHALDLAGRERVVFVDASVSAPAPFEWRPVRPARDATHTTHAMSPEAVLDTYRRVVGEPPPSFCLAIRGESFELGAAPGAVARRGLDEALAFFLREIAPPTGARFEVRGIVQGVGFRPWVVRTARSLGLAGRVRNTPSQVTIDAWGPAPALDALERALLTGAPAAARVDEVRRSALAPEEGTTFDIEPSTESAAGEGVPIPADLAACDACLAEVADPRDRHHGYAFTSCTDCGPRFAVVEELPYDRARTTLAHFVPCAACAAEYADAGDRRFHAQTLACPACGPRLWLADARGVEQPCADPLTEAARLLAAGRLVAIRGLGAFHLACDATNADAVRTARDRKRRDAKPFAVMVADVAAAEALGELDDTARAALLHPARPIVLVPGRDDAGLAKGVCGPSGRVGLLLPYTPLHHRLVALVGRPLVMTSGNVAGEPVAIDNDEAVRTLGDVADAFLLHDRPIAHRAEDSVVSPERGRVRVVRRSRGFAPRHLALPFASPEPVLALGGQLKNTFTVVVGDRAYPGPHLGDLDGVAAERAFLRELDAFERLLRVRPAILAHDLHPDYATTRLAQARPARVRHAVQHHVAHVLAAVAELQLAGPVVGVAYDGTGFGTDGTAWGAELLLVDGARWRRLASLRPMGLPGGELAIRETWRQALALAFDALGRDSLELVPRLRVFDGVPRAHLETMVRLLETGVSTPRVRGLGRNFDALGALVLGQATAAFEGHVALALEEAADPGPADPLPFVLPASLATDGGFGPTNELDLRPMTRAVLAAIVEGVPAPVLAARIHETWVAATAAIVRRAIAETGAGHVVLTGGGFLNRRLTWGLVDALGGVRVHLPRELPVNDGGLALGQAWAAVLALANELGR